MRIRTWLGQFVRLFTLRREPIVLWRLEDWRGIAEASCLCRESAPGQFRVMVAYAGAPEVERAIAGIDALLRWSDQLRGQLEANGWRGIDDLSGRRAATRRHYRGGEQPGEPVHAGSRRRTEN